MDKALNIVGAIITVALVTTLVLPERQTANVVRSLGDAFSNSIRAAMGR